MQVCEEKIQGRGVKCYLFHGSFPTIGSILPLREIPLVKQYIYIHPYTHMYVYMCLCVCMWYIYKYIRSLWPSCKSRNNSVYYVASKLSNGKERRFNFGLFCCGLFVYENRNPDYKSIGRQIPVVYVVFLVLRVQNHAGQKEHRLNHFVWITKQKQTKIFKKNTHQFFVPFRPDFYSVVYSTILYQVEFYITNT